VRRNFLSSFFVAEADLNRRLRPKMEAIVDTQMLDWYAVASKFC
jgi:hypothetical protein